MFIISSWQKLIPNIGYARHWSIAKKKSIQLPIKNGKIDFDFMENFIAKLEAEHIAKLEAYLIASKLKDYTLTSEENQVLQYFEQQKFKWQKFKLSDVFEVYSSKKRFDANKVKVLENGNFPYIVRTSLNNGQKGFINQDETFLNDENTISFGQDTATMFYQERPYFTGDKIKILKPKDEKFNKHNAQFFILSMFKAFSSFSWGGSSFNVKIIQNQKITLPISTDGKIDFDVMETFISAIQKLVIKDVVRYANKKIEATKTIVEHKKP